MRLPFDQIGIVLFGMTAVWLVNDHRPEVARWGPVLGLISQPFWYWTSLAHHQWGIAVCSLVYTWSWYRGVRNKWRKTDGL
jgi:hypothetical protein